MAAISQTTCLSAFLWMKMFVFRVKFHWSLFLGVQMTIDQHWLRSRLGTEQATNHYLNQCWPSSPMHICITRWKWVKSYPCKHIIKAQKWVMMWPVDPVLACLQDQFYTKSNSCKSLTCKTLMAYIQFVLLNLKSVYLTAKQIQRWNKVTYITEC